MIGPADGARAPDRPALEEVILAVVREGTDHRKGVTARVVAQCDVSPGVVRTKLDHLVAEGTLASDGTRVSLAREVDQ